jgi:hypothetical protein
MISNFLSRVIDQLSDFLSRRKGLLPFIGIILILINLVFQFIPSGWVSSSQLFLHLGIILAILGLMLFWVL